MSEPVTRLTPRRESPVDAARRLEREAREIAGSASQALLTDLLLVAGRCGDLASLESLPPGLRDLLRRMGEQIAADVEKAQAISARSGQ